MRNKDEAKEQHILETALHLIARTGLAGLRMSELAQAAGLATGTVYIYFKNKEALIRQLYLYITRRGTLDLAKNLSETAPLKERIIGLARSYFDQLIEHPEYSIFLEQYYRSPWCDLAATDEAENALFQPIIELLNEGQAVGLLKQTSPDLMVTLICGMLDEVARQSLLTQTPVQPDDWQAIAAILWDGIQQ